MQRDKQTNKNDEKKLQRNEQIILPEAETVSYETKWEEKTGYKKNEKENVVSKTRWTKPENGNSLKFHLFSSLFLVL